MWFSVGGKIERIVPTYLPNQFNLINHYDSHDELTLNFIIIGTDISGGNGV